MSKVPELSWMFSLTNAICEAIRQREQSDAAARERSSVDRKSERRHTRPLRELSWAPSRPTTSPRDGTPPQSSETPEVGLFSPSVTIRNREDI